MKKKNERAFVPSPEFDVELARAYQPEAPSLSEWRAEIERLESSTRTAGMTAVEISKALRISSKKTIKLLRILKEAGRLKASRKPVEAIDGRIMMVPCYSIVSDGL